MTEIISIVPELITAFVAAFLGWFFTRKKQKAEVKATETNVKGAELDIVEQAVGIWRKLAEDLNEDLKAARKQITEVQTTLGEILIENEKLTSEIKKLEKDVERLSTENRKLHTLIKQRK